MPQRHLRRRPERNQEAEINRMTDLLVEHRRLETNRRELFALQVECDLAQSKEIEMAYHKRATEDGQPTDPIERPQSRMPRRVFNVPQHFGHGPPLPVDQLQP